MGDINESVEFNISGTPTYSGVISDAITPTTVTKTGDGTLTLPGANTYTGSTTINGGTLAIQNNFTTSSELLGSGTLEFSKHDIFFNIGRSSNFTGTINVINDGNNPTRIKLGNGSDAVTINLSKATIELNGVGSDKYSELAFPKTGSNLTIGTLNGNAYCRILTTENVDAYCDLTVYKGDYAGIIGRAGSSFTFVNRVNLIKANDNTVEGGGTLELSGKNYYWGTTTIKGGTLKLTGDGTLGTGAVNFAQEENSTNIGTLEFAHTSDQTIANNISGSGNVVRSGSDVVILSGDLTYTGTTTINDGATLKIVNSNSGYKYFTASTALKGSGTLALAGTSDWIGFSINATDLTNPQEFTGTVNVSGNVMIRAKNSTKKLNLGAGTLHLDEGATIGLFVNKSGSNVNISPLTVKELNTETGSTIRLCNTNPGDKVGSLTVGSGTVNGNLGIANPSSAQLYYNWVDLVKVSDGAQDGGTLTINGNNYYTGTTTIQGGTLKLTGAGTLGTGNVTLVTNQETNTSGTLEFNNSTATIAPNISGAGDILVSAGTATLSGAVTQTGGATTLADGTSLSIGSASTLYNLSGGSESNPATLTVTGDLSLSNDDESTFIGSITAQKITVNTLNDVALKLYADANNKVTAESLTVSSGELDFKGYFEGSIEVFNGSIFSPGNSVGTADITGNITFAGATADSNGVALFEFGEYADGADVNHDLFVMENGGIFTADDGVILLDFANNDENLWATAGNKYLLVSGGGFADGDDNYANWLASTPDYSDLFKLTGIDGSLYLVGLKAAPEPGSGVPEPSTWALLLLGTAGLLYVRKRKN